MSGAATRARGAGGETPRLRLAHPARRHRGQAAVAAVKEIELVRPALAELSRLGFEIYHEVSTGRGSKRADAVARRGAWIVVVEAKRNATLSLMSQAMGWHGESVLLVTGESAQRAVVTQICRTMGWGWWSVDATAIREEVRVPIRRRSLLARFLCEEQRDLSYGEAGMSGGGYFTPFRATCRNLLDAVRRNPGIELRQALAEIEHHYSSSRSAMSSLPDLLRRGVVEGVALVEGRPLRLKPGPVVGP